MLYLSRFIYNYYIVFFKKGIKKAQKARNLAKGRQRKNGIGMNRSRFRVRSRKFPLRTKLCNVWRLRTLDIMRLIFRKVRLELHFCDGTPASVEQDYYTASRAICKLAKLTIFDELFRENNYQ